MGSPKNRRKKRQRSAKRRASSWRKRAFEAMPVLAKIRDDGGVVLDRIPGLCKMSEVLLEFADPLLEGANAAECHATLDFAAAVWNALQCDRHRQLDGANHLADLRRGMIDKGADQPELDEIIDMLVERKRALFDHDARLIVGVALRPTKSGSPRVEVGSMLPPDDGVLGSDYDDDEGEGEGEGEGKIFGA